MSAAWLGPGLAPGAAPSGVGGASRERVWSWGGGCRERCGAGRGWGAEGHGECGARGYPNGTGESGGAGL